MTECLNILILSCGTRNKIVQYFKNELNGRGQVIATDSSELAPALYEADKYYIVPRVDEEDYLETILKICKVNKIKAIISLIDPELSILAKNKDKFMKIGATPIVSDFEAVELSFDKYKFYNFLVRNKIPTVRSYIDIEEFYSDVEAGEIHYPVFVKPVKGSASINISKVESREELEMLFNRFDNLMIQEYMDGTEYGVDVYIDLISEEPIAIFIKEKIKMRAGETDKSVSIKDDRLSELIKSFVEKANYKGIIDIDVFKVNGEYYISEVNPRFGGGFPHAYESGINVPKYIINNMENVQNESEPAKYDEGVYMLKYNEVKITRSIVKQ